MPYANAIYQFLCDHFGLHHRFAIDIGASDGVFAVEIAKIYDQVLLIEPITEYYPYRKLPPNCEELCLALSDEKGKANLRIPHRLKNDNAQPIFPFGSLSPHNDFEQWRYMGYDHIVEREVDIDTLDNIMKNRPFIDAIKMDVEGHEYNILKGAHDTLQRCPLWVIEIIQLFGNQYIATFEKMREYSFQAYYISDNALIHLSDINEAEKLQGDSIQPDQHIYDFIFIKPN